MSKTRRIPQQNSGKDGQRKEKTCGNEEDQKNSATKPRERRLEERKTCGNEQKLKVSAINT